jgi:prepilin-type processing-associated H-X9-DG protein
MLKITLFCYVLIDFIIYSNTLDTFVKKTVMPLYILLAIIALLIFSGLKTVQQGNVAVVTVFGKYRRVIRPGLNLLIPFIETVFKRISTQNRSVELEFQAVTIDQANVYFKSMLLFSVQDDAEDSIKKVAFKFIDEKSLMQALIRTIEGNIRAFVATKKQAEVLSLRNEIIDHVKEQIDNVIEEWGYHLHDLQINDITFDEAVMRSMSQVVASSNLKAAAENEGQALLITKTKAAEADGNAIKIAAQAEREAAQLRGQGVALFREEVAKGMQNAAREMQQANLDTSMIMFSMWTEAIKNFAEYGKGNVLFLDGSPDGMQKVMKQMMGMDTLLDNSKKGSDQHK